MSIAVVGLGSPAVVEAGIIGTSAAIEAAGRAADISTVNAALARAEVREQLAALGVDAAQIEARVAAMTDAELHTLTEQIESAPAGAGAIEVIGIVFLVLLILEAVGVIDIFKKFP
ncbi:MAG TPA: PA2779 family protein [Steroidobacteraceae bacterium]|nr:PA2779 family protein [Steroidobacteraceae bacterium]